MIALVYITIAINTRSDHLTNLSHPPTAPQVLESDLFYEENENETHCTEHGFNYIQSPEDCVLASQIINKNIIIISHRCSKS